ncbi:MAG: hypothetical protein JWL71_4447 [Acidobacteria bacterium]|nr:hypothetical protein [Acidobacteriota bacterium]
MPKILIKIVVAVAVLGGLGWLFVRSAQNVRSEPYEIARGRLSGWTLAVDAAPNASGILLGLQPDKTTAATLFNQVFSRTGESLSGPVPAAIPLVLQREFDAATAGTFTADALLASARAAGLESSPVEPRCMAHRRISEPGVTRQVYFIRFDWPALASFRQQTMQQMRAAGGRGLDPSALTPILIVAATDAAFARWLPLTPESADDCLAPMAVK